MAISVSEGCFAMSLHRRPVVEVVGTNQTLDSALLPSTRMVWGILQSPLRLQCAGGINKALCVKCRLVVPCATILLESTSSCTDSVQPRTPAAVLELSFPNWGPWCSSAGSFRHRGSWALAREKEPCVWKIDLWCSRSCSWCVWSW